MEITLRQALVHASLFGVTFITTTLAGAEWTYGKSMLMGDFSWDDFVSGMSYSIPFLAILSAHEFGHYFVAVYHRVKTTLPYYLPLPPVPFMLGTLGALIRLKSRSVSTQQHFDIGIAGPLAGFVVALGVLWYGFTHLPPPDHIFIFHPEYRMYGLDYANYVYTPHYLMSQGGADVIVGKNIVYLFFEKYVGIPNRIPNTHEIMHYPYLFAGLLSLVFTSINLLPLGQLDGGHVLYGLLGFNGHRKVASVVFIVFLFYAGLGYLNFFAPPDELVWQIPLFIGFLYLCLTGLKLDWKNTLVLAMALFTAQYIIGVFFPATRGYPGWLLFALIIGRFIGVLHPPSTVEQRLSPERQLLGWIALIIFLGCFAPNPIEIIPYTD